MSYAEDFTNLERANAQIDIWIDEEEYEKVEESCKINKETRVQVTENKHEPLSKVLITAFSDEFCTANKDDEWLSIFNQSTNYPVTAIDLSTQENDRINIDLVVRKVPEAWSHFFWAKFIRARIQQKGTDCYFRRLDQVVGYLERHCPPVRPLKQGGGYGDDEALLSNILAVIYLLEMAACGEAADQRSFAERARRILREIGGDESFYDFLARYNIGVGYFHERAYRNAVREFNLIIQKLKPIWNSKGNFTICPTTMEHSIHQRLGRKLLYLPSVLYRAEIQLKLQLAYHAQRTLSDEYLGSPGPYKQSRANLIKAEAYQQMGRWERAWQILYEVYAFVHSASSLKCKRVVEPFNAEPGARFSNLKGRLQSLMIAYCFNELKENWGKLQLRDVEKKLGYLNQFFSKYKSSTAYQKENRKGYFEQLAEYIAFLAENATENSEKGNEKIKEEAKKIAKEVFESNKDILASENEAYYCPCKEKGIDLRRLDQNHYDTYCTNVRKFFKKFAEQDLDLKKDQKKFLNRLKILEKESRENLHWRIRKIELEKGGDSRQSWCTGCLSQGIPDPTAFAKLLVCAKQNDDEDDKKNSKSLDAKDYERIMDHWDEHFLEHMKDPSFHDPRCRALHFLGLQRWNSSSPAQGRSLGGGYLLYHTDKHGCIDLGIVIDPGFDFVRNLFHVGFSLADIDVVLLSHAHVDHVRDFESIVTLLLELRKRTRYTKEEIRRKIHAIMTLGVYRRLEHIFDSPGLREFVEPYIFDIEKEIDPDIIYKYKLEFTQEKYLPNKPKHSNQPQRLRFAPLLPGEKREERLRDGRICLEISPTKAYHNDFSEYSDSFGFSINIKDPKTESQIDYTFGYTGDTSWHGDIIERYKRERCNSLLVHLGSLIDRENPKKRKFSHYDSVKRCFELICDKNHPYLMGMLHFLTEIFKSGDDEAKPLILMGEFGEELRGKIRLDFISRLKETYDQAVDILPIDVGVDVLLDWDLSSKCKNPPILKEADKNPKVWCVQCRYFVTLADVDFIPYGHDEALFCVCKTCKKATPDNVLKDRLRALYEVGRRLQIH